MDRLTKRLEDGQAVMDCAACGVSWHKKSEKDIPYCTTLFCRNRLKERLAAYEDTGMEPGEIERIVDAYGRGHTLRTESAERLEIIREIKTDRLRELEQAEQDGRLVVLPCKVGDVVFTVDCEYLDCNSCDMLEHGKYCPYIDKPICPKGTVRRRVFHYSLIPYIGKTVFLTREEAEAALAGKVGEG